jgi:hypothetical protein
MMEQSAGVSMYSIKEHIYEISLNGVNRRAVFLHSWLWIHHHAIPISDAAGNYTPCNLLFGSSDCHLLQIFEGLNYVIHICLTYAVFTLNWT